MINGNVFLGGTQRGWLCTFTFDYVVLLDDFRKKKKLFECKQKILLSEIFAHFYVDMAILK